MRVVIFDDTGSFDPSPSPSVQDEALHLQHRDDDFSKRYLQGATVTQVEQHTYYLRTNVGTSTFQLMHYDGYMRDEPLVDNVVALAVHLLRRAQRAAWRSPPPRRRPRPTVPSRPLLTRDLTVGDEYRAGENCLFMVDGGGQQVSRAAESRAPDRRASSKSRRRCCKTGRGARTRPRPIASMPTCSGCGAWACACACRSPRPTCAARPACSSPAAAPRPASARLVPDQDIRFEVAPRNLNLGR